MANKKKPAKKTVKAVKTVEKVVEAEVPKATSKTALRGRLANRARENKKQIVVGAVVLLIALLPSAYFYNKYQDSKAKTEDPEASEQAETEMLIKEISEHALLPTDEEPTVATVSDVTQLADQPFFNDAVNGDRLLVYSKAQKVVLYRPSIKRVINMTSLNIENTTEGTTPAQ